MEQAHRKLYRLIKILPTAQTMYSAMLLDRELKAMGFKSIIVSQVQRNDTNLYIIYGCPRLRIVPPNYIIYQIEVAGTKHFNRQYFELIKNAKAVWEYSMDNCSFYRHVNQNIHYMPPLADNNQSKLNKDIPYLFYGWIDGSVRRKWLLNELSKHLNITIVTNKIGGQMWRLLHRTWTVINIHYYNSSPMELFRINEAISHGCNVISEGQLEGIDCANSVAEFIEKAKNPTRATIPNNKVYLEKYFNADNTLQ